MNPPRILSQIALVAGTLLFSIGLQTYAQTWSPPSGPPPTSNAYAPIHTGDTGQIKSGNLQVNALGIQGTGNAFLVPNGNVGIGTTNPQYRLSVGNQNNPFQVSDAGDVIINGGIDGNWALYYPDASRGVLTINSGGVGVHSGLQVDGTITQGGGTPLYKCSDSSAFCDNSNTCAGQITTDSTCYNGCLGTVACPFLGKLTQ